MDPIRELLANMELEELRATALNASLAESAPPELFRLMDVLGLDMALKLMMTLPGVTVTIPSAEVIPGSINMASAALALLKKKMVLAEAAVHYQVNPDRLLKVVRSLRKHYTNKAKTLAKVRKETISVEVRRMFDKLERGELPDF
jgi:hypothetical protein